MADLIEKFFHSELTEAEDDTLLKELASSENEAERFAVRAEQEYFSFGLPEPHAPGKLVKFLRSSWGRLFPVVVAVGGVTVLYYSTRVTSKPETAVLSAPRVVSTPWVAATAEINAPVKAKKSKALAVPTPRIQMGATPVPVSLGQAPPNPGFDTDYRNLKVVVDQEKAGPVTVQILSPEGFVVRRLYVGSLGEGKWAFSWDGIMDDGMAAETGTYHIEVKGEAVTMNKEVIVH